MPLYYGNQPLSHEMSFPYNTRKDGPLYETSQHLCDFATLELIAPFEDALPSTQFSLGNIMMTAYIQTIWRLAVRKKLPGPRISGAGFGTSRIEFSGIA